VILLRFVRVALLLAGLGQSACGAPAPAVPLSQSEIPRAQSAVTPSVTPTAPAAKRYDLEHDERRGGHTLARHVGKSDAELSRRLRQESQITAASTYTDRATAERVVAETLERHRARIGRWLARQGSRPNLALDFDGDRRDPIGRSLTRRRQQPVACTDAVVVLRWDGEDGFYVLTSYPEAPR
jgi:hypothetical protein